MCMLNCIDVLKLYMCVHAALCSYRVLLNLQWNNVHPGSTAYSFDHMHPASPSMLAHQCQHVRVTSWPVSGTRLLSIKT